MIYALRSFGMLFLLAVLAACQSTASSDRPTMSRYCDNYLIYDMCVQDNNSDGVTDLVYFEDTQEVFLYQEGEQDKLPDNLAWHRCPQAMDEELLATTSRIFFTDEDTTLIERTDIKGALVLNYIRLMPDVMACTLRAEQSADEQ